MTTLKDLLSIPRFSDLQVLNKNANLNLPVTSIEITETPDIASYIPKNVFLLTTAMSFRDDQNSLIQFINSLISVDAAGLGIKVNRFLGEIDSDVLDYADQKNFALVGIPGVLPLGSLLHQMTNYLWNTKQEEINYAMDIQKTFSSLLMSDANIDFYTSDLGKMIKTPVLLLDPFFKVLSHSKHFNHSKELENHYAKQAWEHCNGVQVKKDNFLIKGIHSEDVHIAVYPIKVYTYFPHYLVIVNPEKIPYPISSFAIEQAALVLSFILYKNLKVTESEHTIQNNILLKLLEDKELLSNPQPNLLDVGAHFTLTNSPYNQFIFIKGSTDQNLEQKVKYNDEKIQLTLAWFKEGLSKYIANPLLINIMDGTHIILLLQNEIINMEDVLTKIAIALEEILPIHINYFLGNVHASLQTLSNSYVEAQLAEESSSSMKEIPRFNYYKPEGLKQLFTQANPDVIHYYSTSILKELAYPQENSLIELQKTLKQYLDNQCEITKTAHDLFVHRNTVKYRIERCEEIIGKKINDPTVSLNLRLALELLQSEKNDF